MNTKMCFIKTYIATMDEAGIALNLITIKIISFMF